jgi:ribosome-associated translation inhibitor RaiA
VAYREAHDDPARRTVNVVLKAEKDIPREQVEAARERVAALERYVDDPPPGGVRLTLRRLESGRDLAKRPYVADADLRYKGRALAAHATGPTAVEAAEEVAERLRRQIRRVIDAGIAQRNEPGAIKAALESLEPVREHRPQPRLKPPEERRIVHRRTYSSVPQTTLEAVHALLDGDLDFHLFRHAQTAEDVVVYRRDDGRIGLIHPRGSALAQDSGSAYAVPEPSRYQGPIKLDDARAELDEANHRFVYFIDIEDGRGKVLYLRHDGDYGLVEPG